MTESGPAITLLPRRLRSSGTVGLEMRRTGPLRPRRCMSWSLSGAMIDHDGPVMVDCLVDKTANCYPMIPSGAAHTDMILHGDTVAGTMDDEAKALV